MQGRGRGSFLGLLLEASLGKSMVGSRSANVEDLRVENKETPSSVDKEIAGISPTKQAQDGVKSNSPSPKSPTHATWTCLDLLGNRGRQIKQQDKDVNSDQQGQENSQEHHLDNGEHRNQNNIAANEIIGKPLAVVNNLSSPTTSKDVPQYPSSVPINPDAVDEIHLCSPQEFLPSSSEIKENKDVLEFDSSSETCESTSSASSTYIPPHRRRDFNKKPEMYSDSVVTKKGREDKRKTPKQEPCSSTESVEPKKIVESELNWQKWKLQRNFKKMLSSLTVEGAMGLSKDIKELLTASRLSTNFPGVSEVNVILDLLVGRVLEQKETIEIAVQVCRLLNAMYPDELPSNLREVLKEYRKDTFRGVANKNSRCDKFCLFLGELCSVAKLENTSFKECLNESVIGCVHDWISSYQSVDESSHEAELKVVYLCDLLKLTENTITKEGRSWIKPYFGRIKNCILSGKVPRNIRENLLDAIVKHALCYCQTMEEDKTRCINNEANSHSFEVQGNIGRDDVDVYKDVKEMLSDLKLENLFEIFQDNLIRDSLLRAEKNELKNTLQEAGLAPGAILEIQLFLEKNGMTSQSDVSDKQRPKTSPSADPLTSNKRVKNLETSLQQILGNIEGEQTKEKSYEEETSGKFNCLKKQKSVEEARNELMNIQSNLNKTSPTLISTSHPPPGFSSPGLTIPEMFNPVFSNPGRSNPGMSCNSRTPTLTLKDGRAPFPVGQPFVELSLGERNPVPRREVYLGDKKPNGFANNHEASFGNETNVSWQEQNYKRNPNDRAGFSKQKGRGRGRRDPRGSLETSMVRYPDAGQTKATFGRNANEGIANQNFPGLPSGKFRSSSPNKDVSVGTSRLPIGTSRPEFGATMPIGCFICGSKDHRSAYCKNNAAMFD